MPETDARTVMWDWITGYRISQMVRAAAELSLAEHCADGPVSAKELAARESADENTVARFLRACAAIGLVTCADGERFGSTPLLATLRAGEPQSLRGFAISFGAPGHWLPWGRLTDAIRTGVCPADEALGQPVFDYYAQTPDEAAAFTEGLAGMTAVAGAAAARAIDTADTRVAVDVGGASGDLLHDLMRVNPDLRGIVFDRPHVGADALAAAAREGLGDRVRVVTGDFFESVPDGADLYLLRYVLHDWDDERCVAILRSCREAMGPGSRLLVLEMILGTPGAEPFTVPSQDLNMLAVTGGRERSVEQFDDLFRAAGLRRTAVTGTDSPMSILEAVA